MQEPSYQGKIAVVSIWLRMILTQKITRIYKDSLAFDTPAKYYNMILYSYTIIDAVHSPTYQTNIGEYPHLSYRAPNSYGCVFCSVFVHRGGGHQTISQNMVNETKFVNGTSVVLYLKSGNNGVFRDICNLLPPQSSHVGYSQKHEHVMKIDPNSTYLEFWVGTGYHGESVIVNADECNDNKVIKIVKDGDKFTYIPTPRYGPNPVKVGVSTISEGSPDPQSPEPSSSRKTSRLKSFFRLA